MEEETSQDKKDSQQKPEVSSTDIYVLFEYTTQEEERFVQYFDLKYQYRYHDQVFRPGYFENCTSEEIAKRLGFKRLYSYEVIVPKGLTIRALGQDGSQTPFSYEIDPYQASFINFKSLLPPEPTWKPGQYERWQKAHAIFKSGHYSYQGILDLYDPEQDSDNIDWLVEMGNAYSNPRDSFCDEDKAYKFYVKASALGSEIAAYNLGIDWQNGYYGKIDLEKAKRWFTKAFDENHANAGSVLCDILKKDTRYKSDTDFKSAADEIFQRAIKIGGCWVTYNRARYQLNGQWGYRNPTKGIELYDSLADTRPIDERAHDARAHVFAIYRLAQHYYLGIDVHRDIRKALNYLDMIPTDKGDNIVLPGIKNSAEKLRHMIEAELIQLSAIPMQGNIKDSVPFVSAAIDGTGNFFGTGRCDRAMNDFQEAATLITSLHKGEVTFEETIAKVRKGEIKATHALNDQLWVVHDLMGAEEQPSEKHWFELRKEVQFKQLKVTADDVKKTTQQFGPRYNDLDERGFLIPFSLEEGAMEAGEASLFKGLVAKTNGEIDFYFEKIPNKPPMIFAQDIDVALIIAFHPSRQKLPTLSIEGLDKEGPDRPRWIICEKVWNPEWIGHTMLGQTLYAADYWLGRITFVTNKHFPTSAQYIPDTTNRAKAIALLKEFELCGGHRDGHWNRVMLRPEDVYGTWQRATNGDIVCEIHRIGMGVDGANVKIKIDPETNKIEEDRSVNLNDPRFSTGRSAKLFTKRYDEIAEMFPVFERGRQLAGLVKTLIALRDRYNFQPDKNLTKRIDTAYKFFGSRPPLTRQQRLCLPLSPER